MIVSDVRMSYREVSDYACRLAHALHARGLCRGDRVVIFMENTWQCAVSIYGILMACGVFVIVNPQTKIDKLEAFMEPKHVRFLAELPKSANGKTYKSACNIIILS